MEPLLGWIEPAARTIEQVDAHGEAVQKMVAFSLPPPQLAKGDRIVLTKAWEHPDVVADVGRRLMRELQLSGSCVKVGGTNALRCTIAAQRVAADNPTKAFEPFTWHNYAMSRHAYGQDGPGEGSLGSTFAKSLTDDGVRDWPQDLGDALPDYVIEGDHVRISKAQEMAWSSYRNPMIQAVLKDSRAHLLGGAGECRSPQDILAMNNNGYGVTFACSRFIGNASVRGSGANARVMGAWDSTGGHQQWVFGYEEHPDFGTLFAVGNNWADGTYPRDPSGLPLCTCWVTIADVAAAMRYDSEVYGLSNLSWFPAAPRLPDVLNWSII